VTVPSPRNFFATSSRHTVGYIRGNDNDILLLCFVYFLPPEIAEIIIIKLFSYRPAMSRVWVAFQYHKNKCYSIVGLQEFRRPSNGTQCLQYRSQLSSGSTLACDARGPRFESRCGQKFLCFSRKSLRYAALDTGCTLTALPRSTQPSIPRGTVNEYQLYGDEYQQMAMGECSA